MKEYLSYLLLPLMATIMVAAQACWGSAVKALDKHQSLGSSVASLVASPRVWAGALLYIFATAIYLLLLSKFKFFSVQLVMAALAILFSTGLSYLLFHEHISPTNIVGMLLTLVGIACVLSK